MNDHLSINASVHHATEVVVKKPQTLSHSNGDTWEHIDIVVYAEGGVSSFRLTIHGLTGQSIHVIQEK